MKGSHAWVGMIGLLQYGDARPLPSAPDRLKPGDVVLMIETDDLDGAWQRMQAAGTPILRPPQTTEVTGAGGAKWLASFVFAFDPDGHLIELNQRCPRRRRRCSAAGEPRASRLADAARANALQAS
jgi:catechol 2,3-dioxygenase-like lactoylglutathione lyase family enzyme